MDADDFNPNNPDYDNGYVESEDFNSDNLSKCLDYAKEFDDFEPLENAIMNQENIIKQATEEITFLCDLKNNNDFFYIKLQRIRQLLNSNQL